LTEKRLNKFIEVISKRQKHLTLVLENLHDAHNVSAVLRTAESVGIDKVYLIYDGAEKFPRISKVSSASAKKWVEIVRHTSVKECFKDLKKQKFKIYSTHMAEDSENTSLYELDLCKKVALVFGNEHRGVSEEAKQLSDSNFLIPMVGLVQSLNVSVSVAVCVYEAMRQRLEAGMYEKSAYTKAELKKKLTEYLCR
jgi:tRNA (guanosine-2'-O-)-methyltransferase